MLVNDRSSLPPASSPSFFSPSLSPPAGSVGTLPLVIASGPGWELRQALGTAVFFGMIGVTAFGLIFTPVFYVATRTLGEMLKRRGGSPTDEQLTLLPAE